jgi:hypothetical protein
MWPMWCDLCDVTDRMWPIGCDLWDVTYVKWRPHLDYDDGIKGGTKHCLGRGLGRTCNWCGEWTCKRLCLSPSILASRTELCHKLQVEFNISKRLWTLFTLPFVRPPKISIRFYYGSERLCGPRENFLHFCVTCVGHNFLERCPFEVIQIAMCSEFRRLNVSIPFRGRYLGLPCVTLHLLWGKRFGFASTKAWW